MSECLLPQGLFCNLALRFSKEGENDDMGPELASLRLAR